MWRTRAVVAVGNLAILGLSLFLGYLAGALGHRRVVRTTEWPTNTGWPIGMALVVLVRQENLSQEVQSLIRTWSESNDRAEGWARQLRALHLYRRFYCHPISEVIVEPGGGR
jgi:hypothetical protein